MLRTSSSNVDPSVRDKTNQMKKQHQSEDFGYMMRASCLLKQQCEWPLHETKQTS
jgi:hypothetical protein